MSTPPKAPLHLIEARGAHSYGSVGSELFVAVFQGHTRASEILEMRSLLERFAQAAPSKVSVLVLIGPGSSLSGRGRQAIADMLQGATPFCAAWSVAIEGDGFYAAAARGIATLTLGIAKVRYPIKVTGDLAASVTWLEAQRVASLPNAFGDHIATMRAGILATTPLPKPASRERGA